MSAAVVPVVAIRATVSPARITVIVSEIAITSSSLCVISTTVPPFARRVRSTPHSSSASGGDSTAVGSSSTRMRAPRYSTLRISTRWASPTFSSLTLRVGSTRRPVRSESSRTARSAAAMSSVSPFTSSWPSTRFSATVSVGTSMKCWWTMPTPAAIALAVSQPVTSFPSTSTVPASGVNMPARTRINVLLPAPFSPIRAWISPLATSNDASRIARTGPKDLAIPRRRIAGAATAVGGSVTCRAP